MSSEVDLLSANCQGSQHKNKFIDVLNDLENIDASIFCLEDTHWTESDAKRIKSVWK